MRALRAVSKGWIAIVVLVVAGGVCLQAQQAQQAQQVKTFQPEVGQAGKDVVWVPTPQVLVDKMLDMAKVTPSDYVIDLGSGDGRTVITAAKRGARALGIEYNPDMVELSTANAAKEGVSDRAKFMKADLFETDFSQATVVTMFLLPDINLKLRPKILEMKPGTRIVSNSFTMGEWEADESATRWKKDARAGARLSSGSCPPKWKASGGSAAGNSRSPRSSRCCKARSHRMARACRSRMPGCAAIRSPSVPAARSIRAA